MVGKEGAPPGEGEGGGDDASTLNIWASIKAVKVIPSF